MLLCVEPRVIWRASWNRILTIFDPYTFSHRLGQGRARNRPALSLSSASPLPPTADGLAAASKSVWVMPSDILGRFCTLAILVLRHLSYGCTTRRLPKLCGCRLPIECVVARAVFFQVIEPRDRLLDARPVASSHPPHHQI